MVSVAGNLYSVPDTTRRRILEVHVLADEIRLFEAGTLVACHAPLDGRDQRRGGPAPPKTRPPPPPPRPGEPGVVPPARGQGAPPAPRFFHPGAPPPPRP